MSLIWDHDDEPVTEYDAHWRDVTTQVREQSARDLEWRTRGYQRVKTGIAVALTVAAVALGSWSWLQFQW